MKTKKKVLIASLSTALGLGIVGSIAGTVAWYQYATKAMTSIVGFNASDSGMLRISTDHTNWKRDITNSEIRTQSGFQGNFSPVTFGSLEKDDALPTYMDGTVEKLAAYLPPKYGVPAMTDWGKATVNKQFLQYDFYLKAEKYDETANDYVGVDLPVYISHMEILDATTGKSVSDGVRVHVQVHDADPANEKNFIIAKSETSIYSHGKLDLNANGNDDKYLVYEDDPNYGQVCDYGDYTGNPGEEEDGNGKIGSYSIEQIVNPRDDSGRITANADKVICQTTEDYVHLTVTVWLEGWSMLQTWDATKQNATINLGMTFDVGRGAFEN